MPNPNQRSKFPEDGEDPVAYMYRLRDELVREAAAEGEDLEEYVEPPGTGPDPEEGLARLRDAMRRSIEEGDPTVLDAVLRPEDEVRRGFVGKMNWMTQDEIDHDLAALQEGDDPTLDNPPS